MLKNVHLTEINAFKGACHNVLFQFGFWQLGVPIGSLFHKKLGPYFKAWGSLLVWVTVQMLPEVPFQIFPHSFIEFL